MALKDDMALLLQVPLFSEMNEDQLRLLAFGAEKRDFSKGEVLFEKGDEADCAFVVIRGRLMLGDGKNVVEATPGALLTELALISKVQRKLTAVGQENGEVFAIERSLFARLVEEFPEAADGLARRIKSNFATLAADMAGLARRFKD